MSQPAPPSPSSFDLTFTVIALVFVVLAIAMGVGNFALGASVNGWQDSLMGGRHFPVFTILVLSIGFVVPVFVVKALISRARAK